ncbi:LacI family DNA-binding transcriptional regulator [Microbacterium sp. NPDC089698]|uniref:LacI family DNA-binding transcriptional regulator n=1 Tax=Microbacterium sp. NPDC089698 TaxID=3364200 RepID=UPI0038066750
MFGKRLDAPRRATIRDVADRAGVSTAAASKVLRGAYGVSESMRTRVRAAMDELDYRPNAAARGLRGKTYTIGVMLSDIHNPYFGVLTDGVRDKLGPAGYEMLIGPGGASPRSQRAMIDALIDRGMDALVVIAPVIPGEVLDQTGRQIPTVVVGRHGLGRIRTYDTVAGDDRRGSSIIVDHLVGLGHRRILHLTNGNDGADEPESPEYVRAEGYREAMRLHGLEEHIDVRVAPWSDAGGREIGRQILAMSDPPTAVHAGADVAAFGLLAELWAAGVDVPGDISIVGYDNSPMASMPPIHLTSVDQSGHRMGELAAEVLLERLEGRDAPRAVRIEPRLMTRGTTSSPPQEPRGQSSPL